MTIYEASTVLSIAGTVFALVMVYQHRRCIAYRLSGNASHLNEEEKAYFFGPASSEQPAPGAVTDAYAVKNALRGVETALAHERRAAQTLKARPHMADLTQRLAAADLTLNEVRESLVQKTRLKA